MPLSKHAELRRMVEAALIKRDVQQCYERALELELRNNALALLDVCEAAARIHDECCNLPHGKRLNLGPMLEPSEGAVLALRAALEKLGRQE